MTWSSIFTKEDERQTYLLCQLHYWHSQGTVEKIVVTEKNVLVLMNVTRIITTNLISLLISLQVNID